MATSTSQSSHRVQTHARSTKLARARRRESAPANRGSGRRAVRRQSQTTLWGVPLWQVARGPNSQTGERVGHARAIVAIGDIAEGVLAVGGVARGVISIGGVSLGVCSLGGISLGLLGAVGGIAVAPVALGGVAVGLWALGGAGRNIHGKFPASAPSFLKMSLRHFPKIRRRLNRLYRR